MQFIYNYNVSFNTGINYFFIEIFAVVFILISGVSSYLSKNNTKKGFGLILIALGLTLITYLYDKNYTIKFGILHLLGACKLTTNWFLKLNRYIVLSIGLFFLSANYIISQIDLPNNYLFPIGLINSRFSSLDYYPLIPWSGIFLLGIFIGSLLYKDKKTIFKFIPNKNLWFVSKLGKYSLWVYLLHQPIILCFLYLYILLPTKIL